MKAADREQEFLKLWNLFGFPAHPPERQHKFHPDRKWKFDFAFPSHMVAVEIDGGTFSRGRSGHTSGIGHHNNCDKLNAAVLLGWQVLRFSSKHLTSDPQGTIDTVVRMLERQA